jgi:hypothetical protein
VLEIGILEEERVYREVLHRSGEDLFNLVGEERGWGSGGGRAKTNAAAKLAAAQESKQS